MESLGDTFAVKGRVWRYGESAALAINGVWPYRQQPEPRYRWWPWHWARSVIAGCVLARVPARTYLALVLFAPRYALSKVAICARVARGGTPEWTPTVRRAT